MAYGGRYDVTKQVVLYVKKNRNMSNQDLDRNIRKLFGCTYADSTYDRIKKGEYDKKFNLNIESPQRNHTSSHAYYSGYNGHNGRYEDDENYHMQSNRPYHETKEHTGTSKKPTAKNYFAAFCLGGLGIYGLFHGANPIHNFGGFVVALLLIGAALACISGGKD